MWNENFLSDLNLSKEKIPVTLPIPGSSFVNLNVTVSQNTWDRILSALFTRWVTLDCTKPLSISNYFIFKIITTNNIYKNTIVSYGCTNIRIIQYSSCYSIPCTQYRISTVISSFLLFTVESFSSDSNSTFNEYLFYLCM